MSKISELSSLTTVEVQQNNDLIPIVDVSTGITKKVTPAALMHMPASASTDGNITSWITLPTGYTLERCRGIQIAGRLATIEIVIHNGTTGIPMPTTYTASASDFTIVSFDKNKVTTPLLCEQWGLTAIPPTSGYRTYLQVPWYFNAVDDKLNINISGGNMRGALSNIPDIAKITETGNLKGIGFRFLTLLAPDVVVP